MSMNDAGGDPRDKASPAPGRQTPTNGDVKEVVMSDTTPASERPSRPVVTLFESYGSGASYIGPRVAQKLGVPFHPQAFSSEEIENAMVERESEGLLSQVFTAMGGQYLGIEGESVAMAQQDKYDLVMENTRKVVEDARQGGVIIGRNGALILADWPGALHVKLDGPLSQRIERAAQDSGIDIERAAKRQKREDQIRADMSIELYGWDPRETERYDLMVNTGTMDLDTCVDIIVQAALVKAGLESATSQ
jgi:cytidylate kinase